MLNVTPEGWKAARETWDGNLGWLPFPVPAVRLHQEHRREFAFGDPLRPGAD